jgi:2-isopropylmalate synthase
MFQKAADRSRSIDTVYKAINKIIKMDIDITLTEFSLRAVSSGEEALGGKELQQHV